MKSLIVVESCHGNTAQIAESIAAGLWEAGVQVDIVAADGAPQSVTADLLVVGAPTHNLGMPSVASRAKVRDAGVEVPESGVREWLATCEVTTDRAATFDTQLPTRWSGSAARKIARTLRRKGIRAEAMGFAVTGTKGPLADGELERARAWGHTLAADPR